MKGEGVMSDPLSVSSPQKIQDDDSRACKSEAESQRPPSTPSYRVGDKIRFVEERIAYTVQAISKSGRWMACTKPFRVYGPTCVIYTVVDLIEGFRGVDNSIGNSLGYVTREDCQRAVELFESGKFEFSHRRRPIPAILAWPKPKRDKRSGVERVSQGDGNV